MVLWLFFVCGCFSSLIQNVLFKNSQLLGFRYHDTHQQRITIKLLQELSSRLRHFYSWKVWSAVRVSWFHARWRPFRFIKTFFLVFSDIFFCKLVFFLNNFESAEIKSLFVMNPSFRLLSSLWSIFFSYIIMSSKNLSRCRLVSFIVLIISTIAISVVIAIQVKNVKSSGSKSTDKQHFYNFTCESTCQFLTKYSLIHADQVVHERSQIQKKHSRKTKIH